MRGSFLRFSGYRLTEIKMVLIAKFEHPTDCFLSRRRFVDVRLAGFLFDDALHIVFQGHPLACALARSHASISGLNVSVTVTRIP